MLFTKQAKGTFAKRLNAPNLTNNRAFTTTYGFDAVNRIASKSYSDSTLGVGYFYDNSIQNDVGNRHSAVTIVAAITLTISSVPFPVEVVIEPTPSTGLAVRSSIRLDQIRTVDRKRLVRRLGVVDTVTMAGVDTAIKVSLGLVAGLT